MFVCCSINGFAQLDFVDRTNSLIRSKEIEKARKCIDSAIVDPDFKDDGDAWYLRGYVYKTIYKTKEKANRESPARLTALESFKNSMKYDNAADNILKNKNEIQYLAASLYNDVIAGLSSENYQASLNNFEKYKKYHSLTDTNSTESLNQDITFKRSLAVIYKKLFEKSTVHETKVKYFNLATQLYTEILLRVKDDPTAKVELTAMNKDAALYQNDVDARKFNQELDKKTTTIDKLDKDNQLKEEQLERKELENNLKTNAIKLLQQDKEIKDNQLRQESIIRNTLVIGLAILLLFSLVIIRQRNAVTKEKKRSDELLLNILPLEVATELKETGSAKAKLYDNVTVLFTDFVGFTIISEHLSPEDLVKEIHGFYTAFDAIMERNGLEKIKTIGDAYLAVCGMPHEDKDHAKKAVQAAKEIIDFINGRLNEGGKFNIRIGVNSGPVVAGIVGVKKFAYDIWGDTVNTAARMEQNSQSGKINISGSTFELVKNDFKFTYRGKIGAKNKGEVDMYFVE